MLVGSIPSPLLNMSPRKSARQKKPTEKASANTVALHSRNPKSRPPKAKPSPKKSQKRRAPETSEDDSGSDEGIGDNRRTSKKGLVAASKRARRQSAASVEIVNDSVPDESEEEVLEVEELDQEDEGEDLEDRLDDDDNV
jgi:hypothetical protein